MGKDMDKTKKIGMYAISELLERGLSEKEIGLLLDAYAYIGAFEALPIEKQAEILVELDKFQEEKNSKE
ncbi:MAG: hypothetical protein II978_02975 [Clostridia bacterium]|nr:hypothetical protein [Clostridia bacterium]